MTQDAKIELDLSENIFTGEQDVTLDTQERVIVPSHYYDQGLADTVYIVPRGFGRYKCLALLTSDAFLKHFGAFTLRGEVKEGDFLNQSRYLFHGITKQKLNKQKPRITLTDRMMSHLFDDDTPEKKEIFTLIGAGISVELWRRKEFDKWCKHEKPKVEEWFLQQTSGVTTQ